MNGRFTNLVPLVARFLPPRCYDFAHVSFRRTLRSGITHETGTFSCSPGHKGVPNRGPCLARFDYASNGLGTVKLRAICRTDNETRDWSQNAGERAKAHKNSLHPRDGRANASYDPSSAALKCQ